MFNGRWKKNDDDEFLFIDVNNLEYKGILNFFFCFVLVVIKKELLEN